MKLTPKKTFLLKQIHEDGKPTKDVIAHKGQPIEVTNEEAVKFAGYWEVSDEKEKKKSDGRGESEARSETHRVGKKKVHTRK